MAIVLLLAALIYVPPVQRWAVARASAIASEQTGYDVTVGGVSLSFPLDLELTDVSVVRQTDTLASVGCAVVSVQLLPLVESRVVVDRLELSNVRLNTLDLISDCHVSGSLGGLGLRSDDGIDLRAGTAGLNGVHLSDANLSVVLSDTAAVDTTTSEVPWSVTLDTLSVCRSAVSISLPGDSMRIGAYLGEAMAADARLDLAAGIYRLRSLAVSDSRLSCHQTYEPMAGRGFDYNHVDFSDVRFAVDSVHYASPDLMLSVRDAAFTDVSGLRLDRLQTRVLLDSVSLRLPSLHLATPHSTVDGSLSMPFSAFDEAGAGRMNLNVRAQIGKRDVALLAAPYLDPRSSEMAVVESLPDWPLAVDGRVSGNLRHADVHSLTVDLPTAFHATASGYIENVGRATELSHLNVELTSYRLDFATRYYLPEGFRLPSNLALRGTVGSRGSLLTADLTARHGQGRLSVKGHYDTATASYAADVSAADFSLAPYFSDLSVGPLTADAHVKGRGTDFTSPASSLDATAHIARLTYSDVLIDSIDVRAQLSDGRAHAEVSGNNALLNGSIAADAQLLSSRQHITLVPDFRRLNLTALHLVDKFLVVGMCGHVDISLTDNPSPSRRVSVPQSLSVTGLIGDIYIQDSLTTYRPQDIGLSLISTPDTTRLRLQSGNLIVKADGRGHYSVLADQCLTLLDSLEWQRSQRVIDQVAIKRLLPTGRLYISSGRDNPVADFLRSSSAIDYRQAYANLTTSPEAGINGQAYIYRLNVDSICIDTVALNLKEGRHGLSFQGQVTNNRYNPQFVFNTLIDGHIYERGARLGLRYFDRDNKIGLRLGATVAMVDDGLQFQLMPKRPTIGYKEFNLNDDNFLLLRPNLRLEAKVDLIADDGTGLKVYSELQDSTMLQDLTVSLKRFDLSQLTAVMPYLPRVGGVLDGDFHLQMDEQRHISVASALQVAGMAYEDYGMGTLSTEFVYMQREDDSHAIDGQLMQNGRDIASVSGSYRTATGGIDAIVDLTRLPLDLVNGFIPDQIVGLEGYGEGSLTIGGKLIQPVVDGEVILDSAALVSRPYSVRLRFDNDPVTISQSKLLLENFTMYAYNDEPLNIQGTIDFSRTDRITTDVRMRARNFQIINSKQTRESVAWGKAWVNFFGRLQGPLDHLSMRGKLDVLGTTDLNYILLDSPLSTDNQMDELVQFTNFSDSIADHVERPVPDNLDVDLSISIDEGAHVNCALNVDQTNYVDIFGGGDLRMRYGGDGLSLTGRYTLTSGEMKYSLPIIPLKTFTIQDGSYVEFTGDPMNPHLNITATERNRASVSQEGQQSRSVVFDCGVVITKTLSDMGMEFIISAPEDMAVQSELLSMGSDQRGKLAVTMLTTGMYLADGNTSGFSMNSALSSFLQSEINNITGNALKTLDLSVGLENSTDASGSMHTDYSFRFAKRFWNNRLKVQIGGKVSTGSEVQGQNQSFFDNVTMEYRLSQQSNQYVKLFYNQNAYDWLEGYTGEYGGGFLWKRKLNSFAEIFTVWKKESAPYPKK